jgi:hypothetical protein
MFTRLVVALLVAAVAVAAGQSAEPVAVKGSSAKYARSITTPINDREVPLNLTGVALRKRLGFAVYAVGSYVQDGVAARTADELMKADAVRVLYLVMERTVEPDDFIAAFRGAVARNHPEDKFAAQFKQLTTAVGNNSAAKGDHVFLVYLPGEGVRIRIADKVDVVIKSTAFAQALWEVYLGANPLDDDIKKGLVSLLPSR